MTTRLDWLYLKVYSGDGDDVGALLPAVLEWKGSLRGVDRWHFLRYTDAVGHHLRVRLRGSPEDVDIWYGELPRLEELIGRGQSRAMRRIIPDPLVSSAGTGRGVTASLYSPERAKYGGVRGVEDAEIYFEKSSQACVDNEVWDWSPLQRLASAIDFIGAVERESGYEAGVLSGRIADRWAERLRYGGLEPVKIRREAAALNERVRAQAEPSADWADLASAVSRLVADHGDTAPPQFPLDLVHMHINRIGLNPLEEALAAHLSSARGNDHLSLKGLS
ncbi:thiopeptide-type bacteriocin biosynthesis protein [Actinomyces timonensis]|uniref:Thiopeptide-type bacteriocin biosynthesis protein n=1 Tax=Actinomyces timonensis TaxID=1288391 RepID=A0AAU8N173_9ACTO